MNTPTHQPRGNQQGLTLIEILVAMSISLLLLAGVIQIFASSKAAYRINEAQSRLQENGRFALQMITTDIRMAGFWGCLGNNQVFDNLNPPGGSVNPVLGGIIGTEGGVGAPLPADSVTLQGIVGGSLPVNAHVGSTITTIANGLSQDDLILVGDCTRADLLQITNADPGLGTVTFDTGAGTPGNATVPNPYGTTNAMLYRVGSVAYTITDGNSGQPGLFRSENGAPPMELVEGVENLQILYGEDTNGDEAANFYGTANSVNMSSVVSVRVNLTLRSLADNIASEAGPVDRRLRRTFSSTVVLRNRVP